MILKKILYLLLLTTALPVLPFVDAPAAQAQSIILQKHMRQGRALMDDGNYEAAFKQFVLALKEAPNNSEAQRLKEECSEQIKRIEEERRAEAIRRERNAYDEACNAQTIDALQEFIKKYPNSEFRNEAEQKIELIKRKVADRDAWNAACQVGTKEAFRQYINSSAIGAYNEEARARIADIEKEEQLQQMRSRWAQIADTGTKEQYEAFLQDYPNSEYTKEANYHIDLITAETYFASGNYDAAALRYKKASEFRALKGESQQHYLEVQDVRKYKEVMASRDAKKVLSYLNSLGINDSRRNDVSDHYAEIMAQGFTTYTDDSSFNTVLSYAKSPAMREKISNEIRKTKKEKVIAERNWKKNIRQQKRSNYCDWWKERLGFEFQLTDAEICIQSSEEFLTYAFSPQALLRIGSFEDRLNFLAGVGYRYVGRSEAPDLDFDSYSRLSRSDEFGYDYFEDCYLEDDYYDYYYEYAAKAHQLTFPVKLRFNFGGSDNARRFFLGAGVETGIRLAGTDYASNKYSVNWQAEMGLIARGNVSLSLYYKQYLKNKILWEGWDKMSMVGLSLNLYI